MGDAHGFNRHFSRYVDQQWQQHRSGWGGPWGPFGGETPWGGRSGMPGPPPWVAGLFGLAQAEQPRAPKVRRGDVRMAILAVLRDEPMNGYQVISTIAERTSGAWKPSPGSVYPTLSQLEDEGLVAGDEERGRRTLSLTEEGQAYAATHERELAAVFAPFEAPGSSSDRERSSARSGGGPDYSALKPEIGQVMSAVWQIVSTGTDQQKRDAIEILVDTRRRLYGLLADGEGDSHTEDEIESEDL